jgi:hypothetical protein
MNSTASRVPLMTGLPTRIAGSIVIRSCQLMGPILTQNQRHVPSFSPDLQPAPFLDVWRSEFKL